MHKVFFAIFCGFWLLSGSVFAAGLYDNGSMAPNPDNRHNLASTSNNPFKAADPSAGGTDQICIFCHTPHGGVADTPLWSRPDPTGPVGGFPLYGQDLVISGTLAGSPPDAQTHSGYDDSDQSAYPNGASRLCLSCHDGTTALGILNDNTTIAMAGGDYLTGTAVIDLSTSHPISFTYDSQVLSDITGVRGATYQLPPSGDGVDTPLDAQDRMQCITCHDPHNDTSLDDPSLPPFWRHTTLVDSGTFTDQYEEVCGQCHIGGNPGSFTGDHDPGPGI